MPPPLPPTRRLDKDALFQDLRYQPHPGQLLVHRSQAKRRVLACGSRWGKSLCASMEACAALLEPRDQSLGWLVAPTRDLVDRIFLRVADTLKAHLGHRVLDLDLRSQRIAVANLGGGTSELRGKSADMPVTLLGEALDFLIVDEASKLKGEVWERYLSQRLVDREGWALFLSTPSGCDWLYQLYRRGQKNRDPQYESWSSPSSANPYLDPAVLEAERARLPKEVFAQEYEARFLGAELEPCDTCGGPLRRGCGALLLFDDEKVPHCPECGKPTDKNGRSIVGIGTDGKPYCVILRGEHSTPEDHALAERQLAEILAKKTPTP